MNPLDITDVVSYQVVSGVLVMFALWVVSFPVAVIWTLLKRKM